MVNYCTEENATMIKLITLGIIFCGEAKTANYT